MQESLTQCIVSLHLDYLEEFEDDFDDDFDDYFSRDDQVIRNIVCKSKTEYTGRVWMKLHPACFAVEKVSALQ